VELLIRHRITRLLLHFSLHKQLLIQKLEIGHGQARTDGLGIKLERNFRNLNLRTSLRAKAPLSFGGLIEKVVHGLLLLFFCLLKSLSFLLVVLFHPQKSVHLDKESANFEVEVSVESSIAL